MNTNKVLIIDNDPIFLRTTGRLLETNGYEVDTLGNPTDFFRHISQNSYHCILLDVKMPALSGIDVLKQLHEKHYTVPVIMISGESTIETAVKALKIGAYDFIEKPVDADRMLNSIKNAIEKYRLLEENESFYREIQKDFHLVGNSPAIRTILKIIKKAAEVDSKVLITGESGTGKSLLARAIHYQSARKARPFIVTNCAAIPAELLESELFGHKKGAFTGAIKDQQGKFLAANGGTIFLDEIGDMDMNMQAKLLNVLQDKKIQVLGEAFPQAIDVRVIAATNKNIEQLVQEGTFREDLYYRLNVIHIHNPALRERKEDIRLLCQHFIEKFRKEFNKPVLRMHPLVATALENRTWPGNIRELENLMERLVVFAESEEITMEEYLSINNIDDSFWPHKLNPDLYTNLSLNEAVHTFEMFYLKHILQTYDWNVNTVAKILEVDRSNLYKKLKKYHISRDGQ